MKLLPFALLFIATACSFQQDPELIAPDSKEAAHELIAKSQSLFSSSTNDALSLSNEAIVIIEEHQFDDLKSLAYNNHGYLLDKSGQLAGAMDFYTASLSSPQENVPQVAYSHYRIGKLLAKSGFAQKAILELEKAVTAYRSTNDIKGEYSALYQLSHAYFQCKDLITAISYAEKANSIAIKLPIQLQIEINQRLLYYQLLVNDVEEAKISATTIGGLLLNTNRVEKHRLHMFQAEIAEKEGRIEDAAAYYQRMQEGLDPVTQQQLYPYAMSRHAAFLQEQGEDAQALKLLQKALPQINAQAVDFEPLESIYHQLEALSFAAGMTTEARDYQHQLLQLTKARQEEQNNLASQYEKAQMLASYQQHQAAQAQREAQARQELIINLIWVGILSVVLSIFGFFLHRYLRLQKRYRSVRTRLDNIGIALRGATGMRVE